MGIGYTHHSCAPGRGSTDGGLRAGQVVWQVLVLWPRLLAAGYNHTPCSLTQEAGRGRASDGRVAARSRPSVYGAGAGAQGWDGAHRSGQTAETLLSRHDEAAAQDPEMEEGVVRVVGVDAREEGNGCEGID
jgi:hypothetical protein